MGMRFNDAVMVNSGPSVNNDIRAQPTPSLHDSARKNLDSIFNLHFRSDDRRGMYHGRKAIPLLGEAIVNIPANGRGSGRAYAVHEPHVGRRMKQYRSVAAEMPHSEQWREVGFKSTNPRMLLRHSRSVLTRTLACPPPPMTITGNSKYPSVGYCKWLQLRT